MVAPRAGEILAVIGDEPVIFVGGTGLYFRALTEGLSDMPAVAEDVRAATRAEAEGRPTADLHAELSSLDPATAARLGPDRQRILRALEVFAATGRALSSFQGARAAPALKPGEWAGLFLAPDRETLYRRIDARFDAMLAEGALDEAAALSERRLDPALPVMRAHGVRHLIDHLEGRLYARSRRRSGRSSTPAITPSASSPGRAISSRASNGSRRRRRSRAGRERSTRGRQGGPTEYYACESSRLTQDGLGCGASR